MSDAVIYVSRELLLTLLTQVVVAACAISIAGGEIVLPHWT